MRSRNSTLSRSDVWEAGTEAAMILLESKFVTKGVHDEG